MQLATVIKVFVFLQVFPFMVFKNVFAIYCTGFFVCTATHLPYALRQCIYAVNNVSIIWYIYNYCQYFLFVATFRYHEQMSLLPRDELIMSTTHLPYALRQCIYAVNNATSHAAVSRALCRLRWYLVVTSPLPAALRHLNSLPWKPAVARYIMLYISVYYVIKS